MSHIPTPPVKRLLDRLQRVSETARGWKACCPAHDDRRPSLMINAGFDGRAMVKCFAGCHVSDIAAAAGLQLRDLFNNPAR